MTDHTESATLTVELNDPDEKTMATKMAVRLAPNLPDELERQLSTRQTSFWRRGSVASSSVCRAAD